MHADALLQLTAELLRRVWHFDAPADAVVQAFFKAHRQLGARERHALAETVYRVLRRRRRFEHLAQTGSGPLHRRLALLGWQGRAQELRAALSAEESDWLARTDAIDLDLSGPLRHNLPDWLAHALQESLGEDFWPLVDSLDRPAPLDLRVNTLKARRDEVRAALAEAGIDAQPTPYSPWGLRVPGKPSLQHLAAFEQGHVEVQDEGSQLLALLTDARRGEMVVDFCAGAGGKTLALGAAMRNTGRLYAFDVSGHRLAALQPRLARAGLVNVHPAQIAHERDERVQRLFGKVDRVLVDAPCSGLGTLRRNPDLKWRQTPSTVAALRATQATLLDSAARLLKPGGRLVYATCSLLPAEGEAIASGFSRSHEREFNALPAGEALARARITWPDGRPSPVQGEYLRLWPHRHGTDGFFAAVWLRR